MKKIISIIYIVAFIGCNQSVKDESIKTTPIDNLEHLSTLGLSTKLVAYSNDKLDIFIDSLYVRLDLEPKSEFGNVYREAFTLLDKIMSLESKLVEITGGISAETGGFIDDDDGRTKTYLFDMGYADSLKVWLLDYNMIIEPYGQKIDLFPEKHRYKRIRQFGILDPRFFKFDFNELNFANRSLTESVFLLEMYQQQILTKELMILQGLSVE
jgi:hypothetical protein